MRSTWVVSRFVLKLSNSERNCENELFFLGVDSVGETQCTAHENMAMNSQFRCSA